jgi:two-component system response regulator AtoC
MFQIQIPPLRERQADLPGLMQFLLRNLRPCGAGTDAMEIDSLAQEVLLAHTWPGNVRELDNVISRACILADDNRISVADLPAAIVQTTWPQVATGAATGLGGTLRDQMRTLELEILQRAIDDAGGDRKLAAQKLGIGLSSLYRKIEEVQSSDLSIDNVARVDQS